MITSVFLKFHFVGGRGRVFILPQYSSSGSESISQNRSEHKEVSLKLLSEELAYNISTIIIEEM